MDRSVWDKPDEPVSSLTSISSTAARPELEWVPVELELALGTAEAGAETFCNLSLFRGAAIGATSWLTPASDTGGAAAVIADAMALVAVSL